MIKYYIKKNSFLNKVFLPIFKLTRVLLKKTNSFLFINPKDRKINIGGGNFFRRGWEVLDYKMGFYSRYYYSFIDYNFNLATFNPFPFKDDSISYLYTSHTLEHIPQKYCQHIFKECFRVLKKGGVLRITCPDYDIAYSALQNNNFKKLGFKDKNSVSPFLWFFAQYIMNNVDEDEFYKNFDSLNKIELAEYYRKKNPKEMYLFAPGKHINWWNKNKLKRMLTKAGFSEIYSSEPWKSKFKELKEKEGLIESGFDNKIPQRSLYVEAVK